MTNHSREKIPAWLATVVAGLATLPAGILAEETGDSLFTIEVVENPSFMEVYGDYLYAGIIVILLGIFFWRRFRQRRVKP